MITTVLFDYGYVLAYPKAGNWFVTPNTKEILGRKNMITMGLRFRKLNDVFDHAYAYLNENHLLHTEEEEISQFEVFYQRILTGMCLKKEIVPLARLLAEDLVKNDNKVEFYDDVQQGLESLRKEYELAVLSDAWPSLRRILEHKNIDKYLKGLIMSCDYGMCKDRVELFNHAIDELSIRPEHTVFIDDSELNLKNARRAGLLPVLMDRNYKKKEAEFPIVHTMEEVSLFLHNLI